MKKKYFKNNESYFKYLCKYKNSIDVVKVNLIMKYDNKSAICLCYKKRKLVL